MSGKPEELAFHESETPHFFKVILKDDAIDPDNLQIPCKFEREHGSSLSDRVCLEVPCGSTWDVGLHRDDEGLLLLRDGWAEFMRHYRVDHGHFIVFRYEGESRFHVIIFDRTACEIEYPIKSPGNAKLGPMPKKERSRDEEIPVVEINEEKCIRSVANGKWKSRMHCPRPSKKARGVETLEMNGINNGHLNFNARYVNNPAVKAARASGALQRASSFQCQNPSSLVVTQPVYVHPTYSLNLSKKFLTACIPAIRDSFNMKLCTSGKKTWKVRCRLRDPRGRPRVTRGWRKFAVDNNLRVGDVCVFEFLEGANATFRVTIFRAKGVV